MEQANKDQRKKNGFCNELVKINLKLISYSENITVLDLSHHNIPVKNEKIKLPPNINELNLSHNKLVEVPKFVVELVNLKILDISFNCIEYFDDVPKFCDALEQLNVSNNYLKGPPLWIWLCTPRNLEKLDISCNSELIYRLKGDHSAQILDSKTLLKNIDIHNCKLKSDCDLLTTFSNAKILKLGDKEYDHHASNNLLEVPCKGINKCCDIQVLNLCNTNLYTVNSNIDIYKNIIHIDLSLNSIHSLPDEFCNLLNLEICILSYNKLLYLPDNIYKLTRLSTFLLDCNELCMLPKSMHQFNNLKVLDLYDNNLYELTCNIKTLEEIDFAQNYCEELEDDEYLQKKQKLRLNHNYRHDGRKLEDYKESDQEFSDDDLSELSINDEHQQSEYDPPSSPEDWDSDEYWIPQYYNTGMPPVSQWVCFVKQKIEQGNFCPMDAHPVSIVEKVKYEKLCNPVEVHESDGQFDDFSGDES